MKNRYVVIIVKTKEGERYAVAKNGRRCEKMTYKRYDAAEAIRDWYAANDQS